MNTFSHTPRRCSAGSTGSLLIVGTLLFFPIVLQAQGKWKNPASKVYVSDVSGEALIDTGGAIEDLTKRSVYSAQGTVIETKKPEKESDRSKIFSTLVYSNGTGIYFGADTRVELKRFVQEPFTPNRSDIEIEPSISQTQALMSRGTIGLCTSKLVAGSAMTYITPLGSINVRGRKLVIESEDDLTKISMLEGESTVRGGPMDPGGQTLKAGQQAIIRRGPPGQANPIEIRRIPTSETPRLDDTVAMACMARKTVYFEAREKKADPLAPDSAAGGAADSAAGSDASSSAFSPVNAFDGGSSTTASGGMQEIVPIEIISPTLPVEYTVSTASIPPSPAR
jgi:hypothetical protein